MVLHFQMGDMSGCLLEAGTDATGVTGTMLI